MNLGIVALSAFLLVGLSGATSTKQSRENENEVDDIPEKEVIKSSSRKSPSFRKSRNDEYGSWFENVPLPPVVFARSKTIANEECKKQVHMYLRDLRNGSMWATQSELIQFFISAYTLKSHVRLIENI